MKKILIVDDHDLTREAIMSILLKDAYIISAANGAKDAMGILKQRAYDLIITDIIMPEMDGLEFITNIRKNYPELKILAVSAYKPFYLKVAKEMGADEVCEKKNVTSDLLKITNKLLEN